MFYIHPSCSDTTVAQAEGIPSIVLYGIKYTTNAITMMGKSFLDLPFEVQLQIYSELLIQPELIVIFSSLDDRPARNKLHVYPDILRVNKRIHSEASGLLYSKNVFRFLNCRSGLSPRDDVIRKFHYRIRSQARFVRHVFDIDTHGTTINIDWIDSNDLEQIRDAFTGITTLELYNVGFPLVTNAPHDTLIPVEAIDLLDEIFKAIPPLKKYSCPNCLESHANYGFAR